MAERQIPATNQQTTAQQPVKSYSFGKWPTHCTAAWTRYKYVALGPIFLMPPATALERFHTSAQGLYGRIAESENESRALAAVRDTLLPRLISIDLRGKGTASAARAVA